MDLVHSSHVGWAQHSFSIHMENGEAIFSTLLKANWIRGGGKAMHFPKDISEISEVILELI